MRVDGLAAITVTYNPPLHDGRLAKQILQLEGHVVKHLVVDNGSYNLEDLRQLLSGLGAHAADVELVPMGRNLGIGAAVNRGVRLLEGADHPSWILTLDQDTCLREDALMEFGQETAGIPENPKIAVVAFNYIEHRFGRSRPYNRRDSPSRALSVITSGSVERYDALRSMPLAEDLFMYFVDIEHCHRIRRAGYEIFVLSHSLLDHREGATRTVDGHVEYYVEPERLFFVVRNGLVVAKRYRSLKAIAVAGYLVAMNLIVGPTPEQSVRWSIRGLIAALLPARAFPPFGH